MTFLVLAPYPGRQMTKLQRNDVMDDELPLKFSALKKAEIAYFHKHRQESVFGNKDELIKRCVGFDYRVT